ncbi:hypothetical protein ANANG_G00320260 [Anguilla anguilla]|uniref:TCTP domain-containing protein n=1 Tax=Anguilla anguilla TaxID=7936 RepID=A0A9D3LGL3_ANGAN|nr:hypothetical protein ANANG_G00320260 [Anguilla anguilla]
MHLYRIKAKLEEINPDQVKPLHGRSTGDQKKIMDNMKNFQFFTGESMNPEGMVGLLDFREDGITPFMTFFKDGLEIEKCVSPTRSGLGDDVASFLDKPAFG